MNVMRAIPLLLTLMASWLPAQDTTLRTTTRLVVAPISITDRSGHPVEGVTSRDLILYDNDVAVQAQVEDVVQPLALVLVVQATASAQSVLDKLRKEISLLGPVLVGDGGKAAVIAFAHEVRVLQDFTTDVDKVEQSIRKLDAFGSSGVLMDGMARSLQMLASLPGKYRKAILLISEKHDRGSTNPLASVIGAAEQANAMIYALHFSPTKTAFANRAPRYCDRRCRRCDCGNCGNHCDRDNPGKVPSNTQWGGGFNLFALFGELKRHAQPDVPQALASLTGGASWPVARRAGLEAAFQRIGEDLHQQYVATFPMAKVQVGSFHRIRAEVRGRPDLTVRTRAGYYEVAP